MAFHRPSTRAFLTALLAVTTFASIGVVYAAPALADAPTITAPDKLYPAMNTTMDFNGDADPVSGDTRAISVDGMTEGPGGCDDSAGNDYAVDDCARIQMDLSTNEAGLLSIPGNHVVTKNSVDYLLAASGAVITNATDDTGGPSQLFDFNGTQAQLNDTLSALQFIPATDYQEKETDDGSLPEIHIDAITGDAADSESWDIYLKVEGTNQGPTLTAPSSSLAATIGTGADYVDDADVTDPEMCNQTICGGTFTNPGLVEDDDQMLLVAWLAEDSCGTFNFPSGAAFTSAGGASDTSVDALLTDTTGSALGYHADQASAVESSISPAASLLDLTNQASSGDPTTVFAGVGDLADVRYALENIHYDAPSTVSTCHLNYTVSDLGNNGMPTSYVGSPIGGNPELPEPGYEVPNAKGDTQSITFDVKDTHPHVTVEQSTPGPVPGVDPTHTDAAFTVTFDQKVGSFDQTDLDFGDSTATGVTATVTPITPGLVYQVDAAATGDGKIVAKVDAGKVYADGHDGDAAYANAASTSSDNEITWDATAPKVTIDKKAGQDDPTSTSPILFTVKIDENTDAPVSLTASDIDLSDSTTGGGNLVATVSQPSMIDIKTFQVSVTGMTVAGDVIAKVKAGAVQDQALNDSDASTSTDNDVGWMPDTTKPDVSVVTKSGQADPTGTTPVQFTVTFTEPVAGFTAGDVDLSGSTAGGTLVPAVTSGVDGDSVYTVAVSGMTTSGNVVVGIPAGAAHDPSANDSNAAPTPATVAWVADTTKPDVSVVTKSGQADPASTSPIQFTVTFTEPVAGFTAGDVDLSGSTAGGTLVPAVTSGVDGDSVYTVAVSGMTTSGNVVVGIPAGAAHDPSANDSNAAPTPATVAWVADTTKPDVSVVTKSGQADPASTSPIQFTVTFTEPVAGFTAGDVDLSGSTAGGTLVPAVTSGVDGDSVYTVAVSGMTTSGNVVVGIPAGAAHDPSANDSNAAPTPASVAWVADTTKPDVSVVTKSGQADPTSTTPIQFTVTFTEPVFGFDASDVVLSTSTAGGTLSPTITTGADGDSVYTVAVTGMTSSGNVTASVPAGVASDGASNTNNAAPAPASVAWLAAKTASHVALTSPNSAVYGQPVHAMATVTADAGLPAGHVQFAVDGVNVGSPVAISGGVAASPALTGPANATLAPGSRHITAAFTPTDQVTYGGSSDQVTLVVNKAVTATAVTVKPAKLTAAVAVTSPGAGSPGGTVTFSVDGSPVGTAAVSGGVAQLSHVTPAGKTRHVAASYSGDSRFTGSSDSLARHDPQITAHVSSAHPKSASGWYRGAVTITFSCTTHGAGLVSACPAAVTRTHSGAAQSVTRTISATDGGMDTVTVSINIDRTRPTVKVTGVRNGGSYGRPAPQPHCVGADALSGILSCTLTKHTHHGSAADTVTYKAVAIDKAGNTRTTSGSFRISSYALTGPTYRDGAYTVRRGHTYLLVVTAASQPTYYDAAPFPTTPFRRDQVLHSVGHHRWQLPITMTHALHFHRYWNIGVKVGNTMHVIKIRAVA